MQIHETLFLLLPFIGLFIIGTNLYAVFLVQPIDLKMIIGYVIGLIMFFGGLWLLAWEQSEMDKQCAEHETKG